ncbi:hypothetical protein MLPF_2980 [Mycobacterium lepromatosis]|nr:hypothetical protein MLPF_2980 [Mycobacterium lepromatosis]
MAGSVSPGIRKRINSAGQPRYLVRDPAPVEMSLDTIDLRRIAISVSFQSRP